MAASPPPDPALNLPGSPPAAGVPADVQRVYTAVVCDLHGHDVRGVDHAEVKGICRRLPMPDYRRVLDICCGTGRHATALAARGYEVTGVDRDAPGLARARSSAPGCTFIQLDQRELHELPGVFDAAVILWQSFGYFDSATNDAVLASNATLLRPGGRLLLDLFHPGSFAAEARHAVNSLRSDGVRIRNVVEEGRLRSSIAYEDGATELMDFELFTPLALVERAAVVGFRAVEQCCWWDERRPPDPAERRYQTTFERV